jgi:hypothetical protein
VRCKYRPLFSALSVLALLASGAGPAGAAVTAPPAPHNAGQPETRKTGSPNGRAPKNKRPAKAKRPPKPKRSPRTKAARKAAARKAAARKAALERAELAALARFAASAELTQVPKKYVTWYKAAARTCPGLSWTVLAGIGTIESDNGRSAARGVHSGHNYKGAEGPMQFEPATFAEYKVRVDPNAKLTPYDPQDAIFSAARMLCADGGGSARGLHGAVFAYNHACWYVADVLTIASRYATQARPKPKPEPRTKTKTKTKTKHTHKAQEGAGEHYKPARARQRTGHQKTGRQKTGSQKTGEQKTGEQKTGSQKAGRNRSAPRGGPLGAGAC